MGGTQADGPLRSLGERHGGLLLVLVYAVVAGGVLLAGRFWYQGFARQHRHEVEAQLSAISELKADDLARFRKERLEDAQALLQNDVFSDLVRRFVEAPGDPIARPELQHWLDVYATVLGYARASVIAPQGATLLTSPADRSWSPPTGVLRSLPEAIRERRALFQDFACADQESPPFLCLLIPVVDDRAPGRGHAVIELDIDPARQLYPFLQRWPGVSSTAESLLVRRDGDDVLFLNPLKFDPKAALTRRIPLTRLETPAVQAVLGREGVFEGDDYQGHRVVSALRKVTDSPWYLVARIELAEVEEPIRERLFVTLGFGAVLLVLVALSLSLFWYTQRQRLVRRDALAAEALRETSAHLEALINQSNVPILEWDPLLRVTRFNRACETLSGYAAAEVLGRTVEFLFPADEAGAAMQHVRRTQTGERWESLELQLLHRDGSTRSAVWNSATIFAADRATVLATIAQGLDITGRRRDEEALKAIDRVLRARNEELTRFAYAVSHDLRSPVVTVKSFLDFLERDIGTGDQARIAKDINFIRVAAEKMGCLLDELLELSRVGHTEGPMVEMPLKPIVEEALALVAGRISAQGTRVVADVEGYVVTGDRNRLVEVFQNLLDNAVKFAGDPAQRQVEIGVDCSGPAPVLFVRDNGIGVDPRYLSKLFGLFEQLDPRAEGTGIGLALVRRIVELHGGRIWVESAGVGQGATFRFTLAGTRRAPS